MIKIYLLEDNDVIESTDYARQLDFIYGDWSDQLLSNSNYSGRPINRLGWMKADLIMPFWVGKTVKSANAAIGVKYEFIRGNLPNSHKEEV